MTELHVLTVFCGADGGHGNRLGVVADGSALPGPAMRQELAAKLGFSETVFVDDPVTGEVDIYTPSVRLPFAGHPLVGTAWLLRRLGGSAPKALRPSAGVVPTWVEEDFTWIRGRSEWAPGRQMRAYLSVDEVDALPSPPPGEGWLYAWAWQDQGAGRIRARGFPRRGDAIVEDEATGASAMVLTATLGRGLDIHQGAGSQILTRLGANTVDVGGRVRLIEVREL
ncbi:MAG: PhzF family phenazine biosynthesis protein [Jatrophihabitans sp.]